MESTRPSLAARIREARANLGLTQSELARRSGITRQALRAIEIGESEPSIRSLCSLAQALDTTPGELLAEPIAA